MSAGFDVVHITETLRSAREKAGLSQAAIASRIGIAERSIAGYELAERCPTLQTLAVWSRALGYKVSLEAL